MAELGKMLLVIALIIAIVGIVLIFLGKFSLPWLGRLPGDFTFRGKNVTFYFPLSTSILISIILTLVLWLMNRK